MRSSISWWFRDRTSDRIVVAQSPNAAIWVFVLATALRWSPYDRIDDELRWLGAGALTVWGLDELARGADPFRRLLGAGVLVWQIARIAWS